MVLPPWIDYIFAGVSIIIVIILIETLYYLRRYRSVVCLVPDKIKRDVIIPFIGSFFFIGAGVLYFFYSLTGFSPLYDLMVFSLDFFMLTMIHFMYSLREDIRMVSE